MSQHLPVAMGLFRNDGSVVPATHQDLEELANTPYDMPLLRRLTDDRPGTYWLVSKQRLIMRFRLGAFPGDDTIWTVNVQPMASVDNPETDLLAAVERFRSELRGAGMPRSAAVFAVMDVYYKSPNKSGPDSITAS